MLPFTFRLLKRNQCFNFCKVLPLVFNKYSISTESNPKFEPRVSHKKNVEHAYTFNLLKNIVNDHAWSEPGENYNSSSIKILKEVNSCSEPTDKISSLLNQLTKEISQIPDEGIAIILHELQKYSDKELTAKAVDIINQVALVRVPNSDPAVALSICFSLTELELAYNSDWVWGVLKRFCRRLDKLTSQQMLQIMHLVTLCRKFPPSCSSFDIQSNLVSHFDNLTLQEMAIVSIAFFKTEMKLNNKVIMSTIMRTLLKEAETCDNFSLAMLCKIIRYSMPLSLADELFVVQSKLAQHIDRFNIPALVHLILSGTNVLIYNKELTSAIINKLRGSIDQLRLKDMERLLLVMSLYNIKDDKFIDGVLEELKNKEDEIARFPRAFVSLVQYLNIQHYFNYALIDTVLSESFLTKTYGKFGTSYRKISNEIIYIDSSVAIECPDYTGSRLPAKMVTTSAKVAAFSKHGGPAVSATQKFSFELEDALKRLYGGSDNVYYTSVLPHFHYPDFVLGFDERKSPQTIPADWKIHRWGDIKQPPNNKHFWVVVITGGWNMTIRNTNEPLGNQIAKIRQLRIQGFLPVFVSYIKWRQTTDKEPLLKQLIADELEKAFISRKQTKPS